MVKIPIFEWFIGDVFSSKGNRYTGAVGATSLSANAFCYQVWLERNDGNTELFAIAYDVLTQATANELEPAKFNGDAEGWTDVCDWLNGQYDKYIADGRNKLTVEF